VLSLVAHTNTIGVKELRLIGPGGTVMFSTIDDCFGAQRVCEWALRNGYPEFRSHPVHRIPHAG